MNESSHYLNRCYIKVFPEYLIHCGDWTAFWVAVMNVLHARTLCSCTFNILEPNGYFNYHQVSIHVFPITLYDPHKNIVYCSVQH